MKASIFEKYGFFGGVILCVMIGTGSCFTAAEAAPPIFVDLTGDDASIDPRDPNSPVLTLRRAIEIANPRDVIRVGTGTFIEPPLTVDLPLTIEGDGADFTIISNVGGASSGSVITIDRGTPVSELRVDLTGLTLRDGSDEMGGGLANIGGDVVLRNVTITGNSASQEGGGLWNSDTGTLHVQRCEIEGNQCGANAPGGGIFNAGGAVIISNSTIVDNHAGDGSTTSNYNGANGGGIANLGGGVAIINSTISGNAAGNGVADNFGTGGGGFGGGIYNQGTVDLFNSTISGNCAGDAAAPLAVGFVPFGGSGGAIDTTGSTGVVGIVFCTITGNKAGLSSGGDGFGGGCHANDFSDKIFVSNSIVANNTVGATGSGADVAGAVVSDGHNIILDQGFFDIARSDDLLGVDPLLGPLQDNGGPNLTHAPAASSPAVDAADSGFVIFTDQRLAPRDIFPDIGSSEHVNGVPEAGDSDGDGLSDADESAAGYDTDPHNPDTDGDGLPDGWEVDNGFNPKIKDSDGDKDGDGKTDLEEYRLGTNPCVFDPISLLVVLEPVPTVVLENPPTNRNFRLLRLDPQRGGFDPVSEWKDFNPPLPDPDPDPDGFSDTSAGLDAVWRLQGSPNYPPPP